jgi:aubergine-like protein
MSVMKYNNMVYRIENIDWTKSPKDTFTNKDGKTFSYPKYGKKAQDQDQP